MTTASWCSLPKEISKLIFSDISEDTLLQLQLTCKSWRLVAREIYYGRKLDFNQELGSKLLESLEQPDNTSRYLIKSLYIPDTILNGLLARMISLCPNLKRLELKEGIEGIETIHTLLYESACNGQLQNFERLEGSIAVGGLFPASENYAKAHIKLKNSLTHVKLIDFVNERYEFHELPPHFIALGNRLADFPRLNSLQFHVASVTYLHELDPFIQKTGSRLEHVDIYFSNDRKLTQAIDVDFQAMTPHRRIKELHLRLCAFRLQDLEYIMHAYPNLRKLDLWRHGNDELERVLDFRARELEDTANRFLDYLKVIPSFLICGIPVPFPSLLVLLSSVQKKFEVFHVEINLFPSDEDFERFNMSLSIIRGQLYLQITVYTRNPTPSITNILRLINDGTDKLSIRESVEFPNHFENATGEPAAASLNYILDNFSKVKTLNLNLAAFKSIGPLRTSESPKLSYDSIRISGKLHPDVLVELSQRVHYIKTLELINVKWVNDTLFTLAYDQENVILMPYTSFDTIYIGILFQSMVLKVCTQKKTTFHKIEYGKTAQTLTKDQFDYWSVTDGDFAQATIYCAEIKRVKALEVNVDF